MNVFVYEKAVFGRATSTLIADLTGQTTDVQYAHSALWGPLTATVVWAGTVDDAFRVADQWLGNGVTIYDTNGDWQWDGFIWSVRFRAGRRTRVRSLEGYANRVRLEYREMNYLVTPPTELNPAAFAQADDTIEQERYGVYTYQDTAGEHTSTTASNMANRMIAERKRLLWLPESGTLGGEQGDAVTIAFECHGWYRTFWHEPVTPITTVGTADTAVVITDLLNLWNPWISADRDQLQTTGTVVPRQFLDYETSGEIIKRLVAATPGYTFGLAQGRIPYLRPHKREQTTADYHESVDGLVTTSTGTEIPPWTVRPDSILRQTDFVPSSVNSSAAAVAAVESVYLSETSYSMSDNALSYSSSVADENGEVTP